MIRLIVRLGKWLDARFPAKVVVTRADYEGLGAQISRLEVELSMLTDRVGTSEASHAATIDRVAHLEASAVHKGAVSDLVQHVKEQKDELTAIKANLGWQPNSAKASELSAMLNGEMI